MDFVGFEHLKASFDNNHFKVSSLLRLELYFHDGVTKAWVKCVLQAKFRLDL